MEATAPVSPASVALEVQQVTAEVNELRVGLGKAESQLAKAKNRLSSLTTLVQKQDQHIRSLHGAKAPKVISLDDYREMRERHLGTKTAILDARDLIGLTQKSIEGARKRLAFLEGKLKSSQAILDSFGKLLHMRRS